MFVVEAEAKTSAGAPWVICVASAELASKVNFTVVPGCAASNCVPSVVNAPVSDAAASTLIAPDNPADDGELGGVRLLEPEPLDEQAAIVSGTANRAATNLFIMLVPVARRRRWWT